MQCSQSNALSSSSTLPPLPPMANLVVLLQLHHVGLPALALRGQRVDEAVGQPQPALARLQLRSGVRLLLGGLRSRRRPWLWGSAAGWPKQLQQQDA